MIPYPGASLPLDFARDHTGAPSLYTDIVYRGGSNSAAAGHRVISSGQTWRCWVDPGFSNVYLEEPALPLEVAWVVEVLSGTGTLAAADGYDPSYVYDDTVTTGHSLGTVNVTGAGTYVLPTTYTAGDILGSSAVVLKLDCTAGSVDVQQVKLRVWPVGGAVGGWGPAQPAWAESYASSPLRASAAASVERSAPSEADAAAALAAALPGEAAALSATPVTLSFTTSTGVHGQSNSQLVVDTTDDVTFRARADMNTIATLYRPHPDPSGYWPVAASLVEDVDFITPPGEVPGDPRGVADLTGAATITFQTDPWDVSAALSGNHQPGDPAAGVFVTYRMVTVPADTNVLTLPVDFAAAPAVTVATLDTSAAGTVTVTDVPTQTQGLLVMFGSSIGHSMPDMTGALASVSSAAFSAYTTVLERVTLQGTVNHPAYRVWVPSVTEQPVYPHRLLQRGDGLGMGSARVYAQGTRQSTGRVFGSY